MEKLENLLRESRTNPLRLGKLLWPEVNFYDKQREVIESVWRDDETFVPAGNMLGKDFVAAFIALVFFLTRSPCRIVTTSVDHTQLEGVLWGEIRRFIQNSRLPLNSEQGGPLLINHLHIRKIVRGKTCGLSYLLGRVAAKGEGMLGHHIAETGDFIPRTLFIADEASGVDDVSYERADTWARRKLIIGNCYTPPSGDNFFRKGVLQGDLLSANNPQRYHRKVIKIKAEDSPNVRLAQIRQAKGLPEEKKILVEGVLPYDDYLKRRATWDTVRQCIGLDAEFYVGAGNLLYPPDWLNKAESLARELRGKPRHAKAMGVDPAEGGDSTCWSVVDDFGLIELVSKKTRDTTEVTSHTLALMRKYGIPSSRIFFDRGGGGKEHADRLRLQGFHVQTVGFGESVSLEIKRALHPIPERKEVKEEQYAYKNRRAQMYHLLRLRLDPSSSPGFSLPEEYTELRHQLALIPLCYDPEGRIELPPKNLPDTTGRRKSLVQLIGHSPDEADSLVLAVYGMEVKTMRPVAGAI